MWSAFAIVGCGGALGAMARYGTNLLLERRLGDFPLATLTVNVVGCLLLGTLLAVVEARPSLPDGWRLFLAVGILGSLTTFSTFGAETIDLIRAKETGAALLSIGGNLGLGLLAVALGRMVGKAVV